VRVRTEAPFQSAEALRMRVKELEFQLKLYEQALNQANNDNVELAKRVKELEDRIGALKPQD
jgi:phage shock protein A